MVRCCCCRIAARPTQQSTVCCLEFPPTPDDDWSQDVFDAAVLQMFKDKLVEVLNQEMDYVWIHDYHLMVLPSMLRKQFLRLRCGLFLHSPFPSSEIFRTFPMREQILRSLLNADLLGDQCSLYRSLEAAVDEFTGLHETYRIKTAGVPNWTDCSCEVLHNAHANSAQDPLVIVACHMARRQKVLPWTSNRPGYRFGGGSAGLLLPMRLLSEFSRP